MQPMILGAIAEFERERIERVRAVSLEPKAQAKRSGAPRLRHHARAVRSGRSPVGAGRRHVARCLALGGGPVPAVTKTPESGAGNRREFLSDFDRRRVSAAVTLTDISVTPRAGPRSIEWSPCSQQGPVALKSLN